MQQSSADDSDCHSDIENQQTSTTLNTRTTSKLQRNGSKQQNKTRVGNRDLVVGKDLVEMRDSTELYNNQQYEEVYQRLQEDGFVLLRGIIDQEKALAARHALINHLDQKNAIKHTDDTTQQPLSTYDAYIAPIPNQPNPNKLFPGWTIDAINGYVIGNKETTDNKAQKHWHSLAQSSGVRGVYASSDLQQMYNNVFVQGTQTECQKLKAQRKVVMQPDCTWLRMKGQGEVTAEHADYYYFKKATTMFSEHWSATPQQKAAQKCDTEACKTCKRSDDESNLLICDLCESLYHTSCLTPAVKLAEVSDGEWHCPSCADAPFPFYTCWTALGNVTAEGGSLCMAPGTHRLGKYNQPSRAELLPGEYTKKVENSIVWQTPSSLQPGDVIMFNIKTIHAATKNSANRFRLSLDTRLAVQTEYNTTKQQSSTKQEAIVADKKSQIKAMKPAKAIDSVVTGSFDEAAAKRRAERATTKLADDVQVPIEALKPTLLPLSKGKKRAAPLATVVIEPARPVTDGSLNNLTRRKRVKVSST